MAPLGASVAPSQFCTEGGPEAASLQVTVLCLLEPVLLALLPTRLPVGSVSPTSTGLSQKTGSRWNITNSSSVCLALDKEEVIIPIF